jgi:hypothetical protein
MEKQKECNLRYLLTKVPTTWVKASDRLRQRANKRNKTVSDVFRHRSRTGKSYCRKRSDVGSERVKTSTRSNYSVSLLIKILLFVFRLLDDTRKDWYYAYQHDSNINIQTVYTATTQTDFMRTVATKWF